MAIRFENDDGAKRSDEKPDASRATAPQVQSSGASAALPFAKPVKAEKKGRKLRQK